jgi:hypothetical protein
MRRDDELTPGFGDGGDARSRGKVDPIARQRIYQDSAPPLLPKDFTIERASNGIRLSIVGRSATTPDGQISGSASYDFHFVAFADLSTTQKIDAAFRASVIAESIDEPGIENKVAQKLVTDSKYANGYWFITGVTADKRRSAPSYPRRLTDAVLDDQVPPPIRHLQVSESGIVHDDMTFSELSMSYITPNPLNGLAKVQPVIVDYPSRGQTMELGALDFNGVPGASQVAKIAIPPARRKGLSTITVSRATAIVTFAAGENALVQAAPGDLIEVLGKQGTILTVDSATQVTLTASWTGENGTFSEYFFIGKCRVYMRSVSAGGAFERDLTQLPTDSYADVVLDANLSAPVAPTLVLASGGNVIRITISGIVGTQLEKVVLYRATGSSVAPNGNFPYADTNYDVIKTWPVDTVENAPNTLTFEDTKFTEYEREQKQMFSYVAIVVNVGDDISAPSTVQSIACGLDAPSDGGPQIPARDTPLNVLWNGGCYFNANTTVDVTSTVQDTEMGGSAPPAGFYRIDHEESVGSTPAGFQNTKEIILPFPGNGKYCRVKQKVDAWDHATAANRRVPKGKYITIQVKARTSGGNPNGTFRIELWQYDGATYHSVFARRRLSNDSIVFDLNGMVINGSDMITDHQLYWAVFKPDWSLTTVHILATLSHNDTTAGSGVNVNVTEWMLSFGDTLPAYTTQHVDAAITYNPPTGGMPIPPGSFPDGDASGRPFIGLQP